MRPDSSKMIMEDMHVLLNQTMKKFEKQIEAEKSHVSTTYDRIIEKQNNMVLAFEMKYTNMMKQRMDRIEAFTNDLAMEQARLTACAGMNAINNKGNLTMSQTIAHKKDSKRDE